MNKRSERKLKRLLSKEQYEQIGKSYEFSDSFTQINTYYDSKDSYLKQHKGAMRIRTIGNKHIFTLKIRTDSITHIELEKEINTNNLKDIKDFEILEWIEQYAIPKNLCPITSFKTIRKEYKIENAILCLDETHFHNHIDYELEYEYTKEHNGIQCFKSLLKPFGITYQKNCPSKLARALSSL